MLLVSILAMESLAKKIFPKTMRPTACSPINSANHSSWVKIYQKLTIIQNCHSISFSKFPDFSLTFDHFPDRFGRSILAIFIHRQLENFVQIFMHSDLFFKEKSQTINIRKGMFLNINCLQFMLGNIPSLILLAIYGKPEAS